MGERRWERRDGGWECGAGVEGRVDSSDPYMFDQLANSSVTVDLPVTYCVIVEI